MINQSFFRKLNAINYAQPFHFMRDTRMHRDELVHSKFIADLLNPKGKHQHNDEFLVLFLAHFAHRLKLGHFSTHNARVDVEYKKIDILIRSGDTAIIIENKVFAKDQPAQLSRYYKKMLEEGYQTIKLIYLAPIAKLPDETSTEKLPEIVRQNDLILACYGIDISSWVNECKRAVPKSESIAHENFDLYINTIKKITGKFGSLQHMMDIKELLLQDDNFEHLDTVIKARDDLIMDFQKEIWNTTALQLEKEFEQKQSEPFSEEVHFKSKIRYSLTFNEFKVKLNSFENVHLLIGFEQNTNRIYCQIDCRASSRTPEYKELNARLLKAQERDPKYKINTKFYLRTSLGLDNTPTEKLASLKDRKHRRLFVETSVDEISAIINLAQGKPENKQGFFSKLFGFFNQESAEELV